MIYTGSSDSAEMREVWRLQQEQERFGGLNRLPNITITRARGRQAVGGSLPASAGGVGEAEGEGRGG